jgi:hypothetical protein
LTNNIKPEKCELYSDFIQSLLAIAFDTYLGDDITELHDQIAHFKWCWNKNYNNFIKEGLFFENPRLYDYFLEFMLEVYYTSNDKFDNVYSELNILRLWGNIFNYNKIKTKSDVDTLIEIYKIMDVSVKFA